MRYFAFEGIDMLGKSTQIELLKNEFKNTQIKFLQEPGFTDLGKEIRKLILNNKMSKKAELFLFLADRAELFSQIDFKNETVIADRSLISHLAYAINDDFNKLLDFNLYATNNILPSNVIFFKGSKDLISQRLKTKELDEIEKRGVDYFMQIQQNYEKILKKLDLEVLEINADDSIKNINRKIKNYIKSRLS